MANRSKRPGAGYEQYFTEKKFWAKVKRFASVIGKRLLRDALTLYYCWEDDETPTWAKAWILGALGYLVNPADAVPDPIPVFGFTDDAAVIAAVIVAIHAALKKRHKLQANKKLAEWFD